MGLTNSPIKSYKARRWFSRVAVTDHYQEGSPENEGGRRNQLIMYHMGHMGGQRKNFCLEKQKGQGYGCFETHDSDYVKPIALMIQIMIG